MPAWIGVLEAVDEQLLHAVVLRRRERLDATMAAVTRLGDPGVIVAVAGASAAGLGPVPAGPGVEAAIGVAISHLFVQVLKRLIVRPRPRLPSGHEAMIVPPDQFGFPSGHATAALAMVLPFALAVSPELGIPLTLLGMLVGISRCYLGVHFPGDVVMGWLLAIASFVGVHFAAVAL